MARGGLFDGLVAVSFRELELADQRSRCLQHENEGSRFFSPPYPAVIDTQTGEVKFDNFAGHWGDQQHLDRFLQLYAVEKAKLEARKKSYAVSEQSLNDGSIKLQIIEGAHP